jgi:heat-inducible transcriptional repressor
MSFTELTDRERRVLEAVIRSYVETAEPAGSRVLSRRYGLGVSPATIRNTMSDLEEKGFLFHPHTSAGRVPTDKAYRVFVDGLEVAPLTERERERLSDELASAGPTIDTILRRAAQSLGVLTQELGVALGPAFDQAVLQRLELVRISSERLLMVLTMTAGAVRTIFVEMKGAISDIALADVSMVLNERLGGHSLREIRGTLLDRLRDVTAPSTDAADLLNIFLQEGEQLFDMRLGASGGDVVLGQPSLLAEQPEFATGESMRRLLSLTETHQHLGDLLRGRSGGSVPGIKITIGGEHADPRLEQFTVVTAEYHAGPLTGVIGVIGPTRMPYEKVISLVSHTSRLVSDLLD